VTLCILLDNRASVNLAEDDQVPPHHQMNSVKRQRLPTRRRRIEKMAADIL